MSWLHDNNKTQVVYFNSSGNTSIEYSAMVGMQDAARVDFYITARCNNSATHMGVVNQVNFAAYGASAASVTAPTAITSATGTMGMTTAGVVRNAQILYLNFAIHASGQTSTFSIGGAEFKSVTAVGSNTNTAGNFSSLATAAPMASANGTVDSEIFVPYFNATYYNSTAAKALREKWYASTVGPSTVWPAVILPKDGISTTISGTFTTFVGAGWVMVGHLGLDAANLSETSAHKYICIGVNSCTTKIPVSIVAVKSAVRSVPSTGAFAYSKSL